MYYDQTYFLEIWSRLKRTHLGVLAHSSQPRGSDMTRNRLEKVIVSAPLASELPAEDCAALNPGYMDPAKIIVDDWKNREDKGNPHAPKAGKDLYCI